MFWLVPRVGKSPVKTLALALGIWAVCGFSSVAGDGGPTVARLPGGGTLGYGPPGVYPGFQGFGLGYHPGYGYGGDGLGVGAFGGYPFYGGPGYPHPDPQLRRFGRIVPFAYYGGPGGPCAGAPNVFGPVGPLYSDPPVIKVATDGPDPGYAGGYGCFTGTLPYPESAFAPFTVEAAAAGTSSGVSSARPEAPAPNPAAGSSGPSTFPPPPGQGAPR